MEMQLVRVCFILGELDDVTFQFEAGPSVGVCNVIPNARHLENHFDVMITRNSLL